MTGASTADRERQTAERRDPRVDAPAEAAVAGRLPDPRSMVPGWPSPVRRPRPGVAEAARRARRHDERECARLSGQLEALERDIQAARVALRRTTRLDVPHHTPRPLIRLDGERIQLRDGAWVIVRPVEPSDADLLGEGFAHLGAVSSYRRFQRRVAHLSRWERQSLTRVDHRMHEALAAIDGATGRGVGVARYVGDPADPTCAHVAVTVLDAWQHRGVGRLLSRRL